MAEQDCESERGWGAALSGRKPVRIKSFHCSKQSKIRHKRNRALKSIAPVDQRGCATNSLCLTRVQERTDARAVRS